MNQLPITNKEFYKGLEPRFVELVDQKTFAKEVSFAIQHAHKNPKLKECDKNSVLAAVMNIAQVGLTLNPIASEAYLIPRWSKNGTVCVLEPSYQGLMKLVTDTGSVKSVHCYVVHKEDKFKVTLGTSVGVEHEPQFKSKEITHVYAVAELPDGSKQVEVMTIADCHDIRAKSESYKAYKNPNLPKVTTCVWVEWEQEMCRKACIKRLVKYLPKSEKWEQLREAIALDNDDYQLDPFSKQAMYLSILIENATIDDERKASIEKQISDGMTVDEASKLIIELKECQLDSLADKGGVGGEGDLADSVAKRVERED